MLGFKICEEFGKEFDIMYNPGKSKCIVFNNSKNEIFDVEVKMDGKVIPWVSEILYLGNTITSQADDKIDI